MKKVDAPSRNRDRYLTHWILTKMIKPWTTIIKSYHRMRVFFLPMESDKSLVRKPCTPRPMM